MPKSVDRLPQLETFTDQDVASLNQEIGSNIQLPAANLQIMNGHNIGKILH